MKNNLDDEIDGLFRLPLSEFTAARNTLAARLKKEGRPNDADRVKLLAKPPISAWTVNQLYWNHRKAFDQLMASGKRLRPAQKLRVAGKVAGMRDSLDARREALVNLLELATKLFRMQAVIRRRIRCVVSPQRSRRCQLTRCCPMVQHPAV